MVINLIGVGQTTEAVRTIREIVNRVVINPIGVGQTTDAVPAVQTKVGVAVLVGVGGIISKTVFFKTLLDSVGEAGQRKGVVLGEEAIPNMGVDEAAGEVAVKTAPLSFSSETLLIMIFRYPRC